MQNKGFTIIELLVVISIIAIMSGIVLIDYRSGQQTLALQRATNKLAQDIRRVQEMAMSARECDICPGGGIPDGYGIRFKGGEPEHYILFADRNDNQDYDAGADTKIEDIQIGEGVEISDVSGEPLRITFTPPDPTTTIKPSAPGWVQLCIVNTDCAVLSNTKTIEVNEVGRIEID